MISKNCVLVFNGVDSSTSHCRTCQQCVFVIWDQTIIFMVVNMNNLCIYLLVIYVHIDKDIYTL